MKANIGYCDRVQDAECLDEPSCGSRTGTLIDIDSRPLVTLRWALAERALQARGD
jgi:hypothetical protein